MSGPNTPDLDKPGLNSADSNSTDSNCADPGQVHDDSAPPQPSPQASKAVWRDWARLRRSLLPAPDSAAICKHLLAFLSEQRVSHVLAYHALPGEPDVSALAVHLHLYTTRAVFRPEVRLTLHDWHSATVVSRFGVRQPPKGTPEINRPRIRAVLLPGLTFDMTGTRLGYGGGFYDRLLAGWDILSVGVTTHRALLPQTTLPREAHDRSTEYVATELGVHEIQRPL